MVRLSPQLLIVTAGALVGVGVDGERAFATPSEVTPAIDVAPKAESSASWNIRFLDHCGYWSHYDHRSRHSSWPIPQRLGAHELAAFGASRDILRKIPSPGDLFLQYARRQSSFVHAGVVVLVNDTGSMDAGAPYFDVYTIEGDTDHAGRLRGGRAMRVRRRLSPSLGDRFLRWADLDVDRGLTTPGISLIASAMRRGA